MLCHLIQRRMAPQSRYDERGFETQSDTYRPEKGIPMTKKLDGKVAIITGAASGIGRATALLFSREGAKVVVADISADAGEAVATRIREAGGEAIAIKTDVGNEEEVKALVAATVGKYGRLDIAFNNAGIGGDAAKVADYSTEMWNRVININLTSVFLCMKYELGPMLEQGSGSIINCSSMLGTVAFATAPAYVAAKHGVIGLTKTAALEYAEEGIRVNAICPGFVATALTTNEDVDPNAELHAFYAGITPQGRMGTSEEIAEAVLYLASDAAGFTTGMAMVVDGGYTAR
jgi:NAD(P)-dependent dehydrogenase (short-subunit alcohol dehydrogenase family)